MFLGDQSAELVAVYRTLRRTIVKPRRIFTVSQYFISFWVPLLKPTVAWTIIAFQQRAYWNHEEWCIATQEEIAKDIGIDKCTLTRSLEGETTYIYWFVDRVKRSRTLDDGRVVNAANKYIVYQDDPLRPAHHPGLAGILQPLALENLAQKLQELLAMPNSQLTDLLDQAATTVDTVLQLQAASVRAVVEHVFGASLEPQLVALCDALQEHITYIRAPYLGTQYFRVNWVPRLGATLSWLIVILRNQCFWEEKSRELRNVVSFKKKELAEQLGISRAYLFNNLLNGDAVSEGLASSKRKPTTEGRQYIPLFFRAVEVPGQSSHQVTYEVEVNRQEEPLIPAHLDLINEAGHDLDRLRELLETISAGASEDAAGSEDVDPTGIVEFCPLEVKNNRRILPPETVEFCPLEVKNNRRILPLHANGESSNFAPTLNDSSRNPSHVEGLNGSLLNGSGGGSNGLVRDGKAAEISCVHVTEPVVNQDTHDPVLEEILRRYDTEVGTVTEALKKRIAAAVSPDGENLRDLTLWQVAFKQRGKARSNPWNYILKIAQNQHAQARQNKACLEADRQPAPVEDISSRNGQQFTCPPVTQREEDILWQRALTMLKSQMAVATFTSWLIDTTVASYESEELVIAVKNQFALDWLENRLRKTVERAVKIMFQNDVKIRFVIRGTGGK